MLPIKNIAPPDWMTDYRCMKIMRVLGGFEDEPECLFVGGCVRNHLLGKPVKDIDMATIHHPLKVIERLTSAGVRFVPTGLDHGTITAVMEGITFEITTLRKDIDTNGRHAVIAFSDSWEEDALRRDFTLNTLLCSAKGDVYDPTGRGLQDLEARHVVFVGDPAERIAEDYLRILRFFRIHAEYGQGTADPAALKACKEQAEKMNALSKERITQEFLKILSVNNPAPVLSLMFSHHVLKSMGKHYKAAHLESLCDLQGRHNAPDIMARLFVVAGMNPDFFDEYLVLSNAQKKSLQAYAAAFDVLKSVTKKSVRRAVYTAGNEAVLQAYFLKLSQKNALPDLDIFDVARYWHPPVFPIKAEELIEAGVSRGPDLGKKLKDLEAKWVAKDFPENFTYKK